jgi:hypothetical protein
MANLFVNIPVPAANGVGAAVDVSAMGKTKSLVCGGGFQATVNVEYATDAGGLVWAPLATFLQSGNLTIDVAARWLRAVTSEYKAGAPNLDVGSDDSGTLFALLDAIGTPVDISALPLFKTVVAPVGFAGNIELSEDGIAWAQLFSFVNGGAQSKSMFGQFARCIGNGVPVTLAAANDGGGGGSSAIAVQDEGVPLGAFNTLNFVGAGVTAADAGGGVASVTIPGGGAAAQLLAIYGDGSFGDHVTAGDETWKTNGVVPGAPVVPAGDGIPFAFFNNLTISPGNSVDVGGLGILDGQSVVICVKETLTIGAGARIHANGGDGGTFITIGLGRRAIVGSSDGADGAAGNPQFTPGPGTAGGSGTDRPAQATATMVGGAGGAGGIGLGAPGGAGGICLTPASWPYSLSQAISIASLLFKIGGGNGGGSGGNDASSSSGSGGGGGGTLVIFARTIVAPAGSLQARGGNGGSGVSFENVPGGGGGGGSGGTIVIVTENASLAGVTDVSGGAGGAGVGIPVSPGFPGGPGEAIGFNPMLAAQIPV